MPTTAPIRKSRKTWNETGHAHFLTYSCHKRLPLLTRDRSRERVLAALEAIRRELHVELRAYVIMPEHVHVLLCPQRADYEMRRILAALKRPVSDAARDYLEQTSQTSWLQRLTVRYPSRKVFRFCQPGGGFDHNIFREKTVPAVINYIHANPVRRELVATTTERAWSSARFWEGCEDVPLRMDQPYT
jgi:putative transposase